MFHLTFQAARLILRKSNLPKRSTGLSSSLNQVSLGRRQAREAFCQPFHMSAALQQQQQQQEQQEDPSSPNGEPMMSFYDEFDRLVQMPRQL